MKMQLITIRPRKAGVDAGFTIKRELFDDSGFVDIAFCSIITTKYGFTASGFSSIHKPTITNDAYCDKESVDDFVKKVFAQ